jgi:hypothetical protein
VRSGQLPAVGEYTSRQYCLSAAPKHPSNLITQQHQKQRAHLNLGGVTAPRIPVSAAAVNASQEACSGLRLSASTAAAAASSSQPTAAAADNFLALPSTVSGLSGSIQHSVSDGRPAALALTAADAAAAAPAEAGAAIALLRPLLATVRPALLPFPPRLPPLPGTTGLLLLLLMPAPHPTLPGLAPAALLPAEAVLPIEWL